MNCNYIIKTPDGGEIIIPAKFGLIETNQKITDNIEKLRKFSGKSSLTEKQQESKDLILFDLTTNISRQAPEQITREMIGDIIEENMDNLDNVVPTINKLINGLGDYVDLKSAIYGYIKSGKDNLKKLQTALKKEYVPDYFSSLSMEGVIGVSSLKEERSRLSGKIFENREFGFPNVIPENLNNFIYGIINSSHEDLKKIYNSKTLMGATSYLGTRAFNVNGFTFFNQNNDLSLFQGLFKRAASNVDKALLAEIVSEYNLIYPSDIDLGDLDVFKFFNGTIENGKPTIGGFDTMFDRASDPRVQTIIDKIINLVTDYIDPDNRKLNRSTKILFWQLNPETYGSKALEKELAQETFIANELKVELDYKNKLKADFLESVSSTKDKYFAEAESFTTGLWENSKHNITVNQDIVQFPVAKEVNPYCIVTAMFPRPNGVMMYGVYKNQFGDVERLQHYFKEGEKITYRQRGENPDPYIVDEDVSENTNVALVDTKEMSTSVKKKLISKGDTVNSKYLVVGVQINSVTLKNKKDGKISTISYRKILSIFSEKAKQSVDLSNTLNFKKYSPITDLSTISDGDFYFDSNAGFYKQVLYTDANNVYSYIKGKSEGSIIIKPYAKENITKAIAYTYGSISLEEIEKISNQFRVVGKREATMSSFTNPNDAKNGDYIAYKADDNTLRIGKVTNTESQKGIIYNNTTKSFDTINYSDKEATFLTNRDISSNYSMTIARVNDWNIQLLDEITAGNSPAYKEARYVVPIMTNTSELVLLPSNYATIGHYTDINTPMKSSEKDATSDILRLMQESGIETSGSKLYLKTEDAAGKSNKYERNLYSLHRILGFDKLDIQTKQRLNIIQPGVYFSLYTEGNIDSNIYRIMEVSNDVVTAHLNKFSNGKLITTEKRFKVSDLLATKNIGSATNPVNSIARLYLQYGNKKFNIVTKTINDKLNPNINQKSINTILTKMNDVFSVLGVPVEKVSAEEGQFKNGQKAKIETTVDENGENPVTRILLNSDVGIADDLVHETLHVYLTLLRYKNPELYNSCLNSVFTDENIKYLEDSLGQELDFENMDLTTKEEMFVKLVSERTKANEDILQENVKDFIGPLVLAIQELNPDADIDIREAIASPLTELNKTLGDLVGEISLDSSHPMFNLSAITTEPMMREWMKERNIILKC